MLLDQDVVVHAPRTTSPCVVKSQIVTKYYRCVVRGLVGLVGGGERATPCQELGKFVPKSSLHSSL